MPGSQSIREFAPRKLGLAPSDVFKFVVDDDDKACANSGATDVMLPDYLAFLSYVSCKDWWVTLGDNSRLRIAGTGTAKLSLNGKVIILHDMLHVPELQNPLDSLRKYKAIPGCRTFSYFGVGSYIMFSRFTLCINDSVDNLVSYRLVGRQDIAALEYAQLRAHCSSNQRQPQAVAQQLAVISADDESDCSAPSGCSDDLVPSDPIDPLQEAELLGNAYSPLSSIMLKCPHHNP